MKAAHRHATVHTAEQAVSVATELMFLVIDAAKQEGVSPTVCDSLRTQVRSRLNGFGYLSDQNKKAVFDSIRAKIKEQTDAVDDPYEFSLNVPVEMFTELVGIHVPQPLPAEVGSKAVRQGLLKLVLACV
jgi:hypothetical protein